MAGLHRTVAEEDDGHRVATVLPCGERAAEGERDVAADHARCPHEAVLDVDQVHRAAEPAAEPAVAPHQLRHRPVERRTLRDRVAVGAMPGVDRVVGSQLQAHAGRDGLLARAQVDQPVDFIGALELGHPFLEQPDPPHRREQALRLLTAKRVGVGDAGPYAVTGAAPSTRRTAAAILSSLGMTQASSGSL